MSQCVCVGTEGRRYMGEQKFLKNCNNGTVDDSVQLDPILNSNVLLSIFRSLFFCYGPVDLSLLAPHISILL